MKIDNSIDLSIDVGIEIPVDGSACFAVNIDLARVVDRGGTEGDESVDIELSGIADCRGGIKRVRTFTYSAYLKECSVRYVVRSTGACPPALNANSPLKFSPSRLPYVHGI
ncbi:MAG: hypothetical protein WD738_18695, partial [Pirellulales bacterium]